MFDFSNLKVRKTKSTRKGVTGSGKKGISYDIRLIQSQKRSFFQMHPSYMEKMGFLSGKGFFNALINDETGKVHCLAMVVADTHDSALFFSVPKGGEKSSQFKGDFLLEDLKHAGLVSLVDPNSIADRKPVYQYLSLEDVTSKFPAEKIPSGVEKIYAFVQGEAVQPEPTVGGVQDLDESDDELVEDFDNGVADEAVGTPVVQELSDDDWS
jgi:hypothetical protein